MSHEECIVLLYGLDTHIPKNTNKNKIYTELEMFCQDLVKNISNISETKLQQMKTNVLTTCDKCTKIKVQRQTQKHNIQTQKNN